MTKAYTRMSANKLKEIVLDYQRRAFPEWRIKWDSALVRENGPVLQQIGFEALRSGEYRPSAAIRVLAAPNAAGLITFLNVHVRSLLPREQDAKFNDVVLAMRDEFLPNIYEPLDPHKTLSIYLRKEPIVPHDAYAIAALAGALGEVDLSRQWCDEYLEMVRKKARSSRGEQSRTEFIYKLTEWLVDGRALDELAKVVEQERERLSLTS